MCNVNAGARILGVSCTALFWLVCGVLLSLNVLVPAIGHSQDSRFGSTFALKLLWTDVQLQSSEGENVVSDYHKPDATLPKGGCVPSYAPREVVGQAGNIRSVRTHPEAGKVVALTFDFCELSTKTSGYNGKIIDFLRQREIPATLFLGGKWMRSHPERAMQLIADPLFEIGNHAWTHGNFALLPSKEARMQVECTEKQYELLRNVITERLQTVAADQVWEELTKIPTSPSLFRLPYGRVKRKNLRLLHKMGVKVIQWDVVVPEWERVTGAFVANQMQVRSGSILLMHGTAVPSYTLENLTAIVRILSERGYRFVTVTELLDMGDPNIYSKGYFVTEGDNVFLDNRYVNYGTAHPQESSSAPQ
ncbi:MAG: polysaccharide deacetylase family protein [Anaplasma sp.]